MLKSPTVVSSELQSVLSVRPLLRALPNICCKPKTADVCSPVDEEQASHTAVPPPARIVDIGVPPTKMAGTIEVPKLALLPPESTVKKANMFVSLIDICTSRLLGVQRASTAVSCLISKLTMTMTMTMTHSEKSDIRQMKAWPYRQECRGHDPAKKESVVLVKFALLARCAQTHC